MCGGAGGAGGAGNAGSVLASAGTAGTAGTAGKATDPAKDQSVTPPAILDFQRFLGLGPAG